MIIVKEGNNNQKTNRRITSKCRGNLLIAKITSAQLMWPKFKGGGGEIVSDLLGMPILNSVVLEEEGSIYVITSSHPRYPSAIKRHKFKLKLASLSVPVIKELID